MLTYVKTLYRPEYAMIKIQCSLINSIYYNYDYQSQLPYNNSFRREVSSNAKGFKLTSHILYYFKKKKSTL